MATATDPGKKQNSDPLPASPTFGAFGGFWGSWEHLRGFLGHLGGVLEASHIFGRNLSPIWGVLAPNWVVWAPAQIGPSWGHVAPN